MSASEWATKKAAEIIPNELCGHMHSHAAINVGYTRACIADALDAEWNAAIEEAAGVCQEYADKRAHVNQHGAVGVTDLETLGKYEASMMLLHKIRALKLGGG